MDKDIKEFLKLQREELDKIIINSTEEIKESIEVFDPNKFDKINLLTNNFKRTLECVNKSPHETPKYAHDLDSGFDIRAWIKDSDNITLKPLERTLINTGLYFNLPMGTELQIRSRSGQALKQGLIVLNTPGTVDESYTGEIKLIMCNLSNEDITINDGDRIAQGVLMNVLNERFIVINEVKKIDKETDRADGGFNSTGVK